MSYYSGNSIYLFSQGLYFKQLPQWLHLKQTKKKALIQSFISWLFNPNVLLNQEGFKMQSLRYFLRKKG